MALRRLHNGGGDRCIVVVPCLVFLALVLNLNSVLRDHTADDAAASGQSDVNSGAPVRPQHLRITSPDFLHLVMVVRGLNEYSWKLRINLQNCIKSVLAGSRNLHLIFLTPPADIIPIEEVIQTVGPSDSKGFDA